MVGGSSQADLARYLGITRSAVSRWKARTGYLPARRAYEVSNRRLFRAT